ncbi:hypothetical protein OH491_16860 [Termitidicoccus mucosus]|uniref:Uncharacterized protein n=1 Tax=Termitidicoccus mucosus TaxID=1184151 RepID=A0A178IJN5_9BACT|nr:hypothetical protein AW736_11730 [Opitutaceae bacterium TSB47]
MKTGPTTDGAGQNQNLVPPEDAREPLLIDSLPMARYGFTVRGRLANGAEAVIRGVVYAKRGMYYQAQARVLDSVLKEIPTLELDENPVGLKMRSGGGYVVPPEDLSILGRPKS